MTVLVTLVVPCRNAGPHLQPMLESLLRQTRDDFRLVLVDDASSDGSVDVARQVAGPRVEIFQNAESLGIAGNWNRCTALVESELFALAHMDDVYEPGWLERLTGVLQTRPEAGAAHCRAIAIDPEGTPIAAAEEAYKDLCWRGLERADRAGFYARLLRGNFVCCPSVVYRTRAWREAGRYDSALRFALDWQHHFGLLLAGWEFASVSECLVRYRRRPDSATAGHVRSLERYREEALVGAWAGEQGVQRGLIEPAHARSDAARNHLLHDAYRDLLRGDREAVESKLGWARAELPRRGRDPMVELFALARRCGPPGRAALGLGLRAAMLAARLRYSM